MESLSAEAQARRKKKKKANRSASQRTSQRSGQTLAGDSRDSAPTTRSRAASMMVMATAVDVLDAILGLALVVYGAVVHVAEVMATCVCFGLLLLLGTVAGVAGRYSKSSWGLLASATAGSLTILLDTVTFLLVVTSWDSFVAFLGDHHEELLLSEGGVKALGGLKVLFAVIFVVLALLEAVRFRAMWSMASSDKAPPPSQSSSGGSNSVCHRLLSLLGLRKQKKVDDFVVFEDISSSMKESLLWSEEGRTRTGDYLKFMPEHEHSVADFSEKVSMPALPRDRSDY